LKIKSDFVTNSSSVNYIVILPSDFKIENYLSIREHANILDSSEVHIDDVIESFNILMMDGSISSDMYDDCPRAFDYTLRILSELKVIVQKVDTPAGAPYVIVNIEAHIDKIRERLAKFSEKQMEGISDAIRPLEEDTGEALQSVQSGN
jgi:hypothetical protein